MKYTSDPSSRLLPDEQKLKTYLIFNSHVGIAQSWCRMLAGLELWVEDVILDIDSFGHSHILKVTLLEIYAQLSNLWWMPNSVPMGFGTAMRTGSSYLRRWRIPIQDWVGTFFLSSHTEQRGYVMATTQALSFSFFPPFSTTVCVYAALSFLSFPITHRSFLIYPHLWEDSVTKGEGGFQGEVGIYMGPKGVG